VAWTANNNPGATGGQNVTTGANALQDAIDQATDGDIIYVTPSISSYGSVNVNKPLSIIGSGIRPIKESSLRSTAGNLSLIDGSSDSRIIGMHLTRLIIGAADVNTNNILVQNSRVRKIAQIVAPNNTLSNIILQNNIIGALSTNSEGATNLRLVTVSNVKVSNNLILGTGSFPGMFATNVDCENNIFSNTCGGNTFNTGNFLNCSFYRNIFYGTETTLDDSNTFIDNLSFGGETIQFSSNPINSGNIEDQDPLFVNFPLTRTWDDLYDINLQAGSPAILDPNDRTQDIGPTGGVSPFDDEGNNLPLIQSLQVPDLISQGSDLPVIIKGKGN
jgi:hypothetical protein